MLPLPDDMSEIFNKNNIVTVELAEDVTYGIDIIPDGSKIVDRVYTYNDKQEVESKTDKPGFFDNSANDRIKTISYLCD